MARSAKKPPLSWQHWTLLGIVACSAIAILMSFGGFLIDTPTEQAQKELNEMADDYYIRYLYPTLVGDVGNVDAAEMLQEYVETGTPRTFLRQLLHFEQDKNMGLAPIFEKLGCNTNSTSIRYYPTEPFGPRDYRLEYFWYCDKLKEDELK